MIGADHGLVQITIFVKPDFYEQDKNEEL